MVRIAAVLVLRWGSPQRVLVERKNCSMNTYWSCDIALPGGGVRKGESLVEAALREAWEEAWIHPGMVIVEGLMEPEMTLRGDNLIYPVLARPRGPLCPRPASDEADLVFWLDTRLLEREPVRVPHPRRGFMVSGYRVAGGVLWGATLRILHRIYGSRQESRSV